MITQHSFGTTAAGEAVERYTLKAGDFRNVGTDLRRDYPRVARAG